MCDVHVGASDCTGQMRQIAMRPVSRLESAIAKGGCGKCSHCFYDRGCMVQAVEGRRG